LDTSTFPGALDETGAGGAAFAGAGLAAGAATLAAAGFVAPLIGAFLSDLSDFSATFALVLAAGFATTFAAGLLAGLADGFTLLLAAVALSDATGLLFEADFIESLTD
jgi:hypothetical protein